MALSRQDLEDLYHTGGEYDVSPNGDGSAMVYVRKMGPTQQGVAVREANAERIKVSLAMKDETHPLRLAIMEDLGKLTREQKVEQLAMTAVAEERSKAEQELSEEEGWLEDGRLQSLVDAWEGGLMEDYLSGEDTRSDESVRVFEEMKQFTDAVDTRIQTALDAERRRYEELSDSRIDKKMIEAQIDYDASMGWMRVYRMYQIMYGVHDSEERKRIFNSIEEVESVSTELFAKLVEAVLDLNIPTIEVKS